MAKDNIVPYLIGAGVGTLVSIAGVALTYNLLDNSISNNLGNIKYISIVTIEAVGCLATISISSLISKKISDKCCTNQEEFPENQNILENNNINTDPEIGFSAQAKQTRTKTILYNQKKQKPSNTNSVKINKKPEQAANLDYGSIIFHNLPLRS